MERFRYVCAIVLISISGSVLGQKDSSVVRYSLGIVPSAIINMVPAIQLSHDLRVSQSIMLSLQTGYIFSSANQNNKKTHGWRLRPEFRYTSYANGKAARDIYLFYNYRYYYATRVADEWRAGGAYTETVFGSRKNFLKGFGVGIDFYNLFGDNSIMKHSRFGFGIGLGGFSNEYSDTIFRPSGFFVPITDWESDLILPITFVHLMIPLF